MRNPISFIDVDHFSSEEEHLQELLPSFKVLNAITRVTYRNIAIIDFLNNNFLYVSDNTNSLCGRPGAEIKEMGFDFFRKHTSKEEYSTMVELKRATDEFLESIPEECSTNYTVSHDINIVNNVTCKYSIVNHQFTPITLHDGKIWLCLCVTSIAPHNSIGNTELWHKDKRKSWKYNSRTKCWNLVPAIHLKSSEKEVIKLSAQGYSINEMASKMNKSFDTIKFYRKNLFKKLEVDNITEALSRALCKHLL